MNNQNSTHPDKTTRNKVVTWIGIVLCIILIPLLIINCIMIVQGLVNKDEVPKLFGYFPLIVLTDSMSGTFEGNDIIVCRSIEFDEVKEGDIITFYDPDGNGTSTVTHQVWKIIYDDATGERLYFITYGSALQGDDFEPGDAPTNLDGFDVKREHLIGKWTGIRIPGAGGVARFLQTTPGWIICICVPLIIIVLVDVLRRRRMDRVHDDEQEALMRELEELRRQKAAAEASASSEPTDGTDK